ncbi:VRR-NUC domain-containing protein, partial [Pseudomonas sp. MAFF212427]|nr:VRR-NUC domain-containing protein [Pseudomonas brassicae]
MIAHSVTDPFYYLCNFQQVLAWLHLRYADLLDAQEREFMQQFAQLGRESQALLVRMVMRKGLVFRAGKLAYDEIGPTVPAMAPLVALGWVEEQPVLNLEQLFQLLRKDEISGCFGAVLQRPRAAKAQLFEQLSVLYPDAQPLAQWWPGFAEPVYALRLQALCDRLRLLFFGNLHQDWSEFVLADLGLLRYEQVAFSEHSRALRERADIDLCLALHCCAEQLQAGQPVAQVLALLDGLQSSNPWLERRRARLLFQLGQHCERSGDWAQALAIYPRSSHPQARTRQIRVLERSGDHAAALSLAEQARSHPANAAEAQALTR